MQNRVAKTTKKGLVKKSALHNRLQAETVTKFGHSDRIIYQKMLAKYHAKASRGSFGFMFQFEISENTFK